MPYKPVRLQTPLASVSLDLEEDHAGLSPHLQYDALRHLPELIDWFAARHIPLSIFVAGNFLERQSRSLEGVSYPEFHSHGFWHPPHRDAWRYDVREKNIRDGLAAFKTFFKRPSEGYRAACGILNESNFPLLVEQGVTFDSSYFTGPHVSGFHLFRSDAPRWYPQPGLMELPISAHPVLRIPVSMSYMNLIGTTAYSFFHRLGLGCRPLVFNFHLHDLFETPTARQLSTFWQSIYRRRHGERAFNAMTTWLTMLLDHGMMFVSMSELTARHKEHANVASTTPGGPV